VLIKGVAENQWWEDRGGPTLRTQYERLENVWVNSGNTVQYEEPSGTSNRHRSWGECRITTGARGESRKASCIKCPKRLSGTGTSANGNLDEVGIKWGAAESTRGVNLKGKVAVEKKNRGTRDFTRSSKTRNEDHRGASRSAKEKSAKKQNRDKSGGNLPWEPPPETPRKINQGLIGKEKRGSKKGFCKRKKETTDQRD